MADNVPAPSSMDWWVNVKSGKKGADLKNALLPYLAPEDQAVVKTQLAKSVPKKYGGYQTASVTSLQPGYQTSMLSSQRAQMAAESLRGVYKSYKGKVGAGYGFLNKALDLLSKYGGTTGSMSRGNFQNFVAEANALMSTAKGVKALTPYAELASMFLNPTISNGSLTDVHKTQSGKVIYGAQNTQLY